MFIEHMFTFICNRIGYEPWWSMMWCRDLQEVNEAAGVVLKTSASHCKSTPVRKNLSDSMSVQPPSFSLYF